MLVSIALTAATVCTARACTKRLDEPQWPETRDETNWAETEAYCSETLVRLETETSRPRPHPCLIAYTCTWTYSSVLVYLYVRYLNKH